MAVPHMNVYNELRSLYEAVNDNVKHFRDSAYYGTRIERKVTELLADLEDIYLGLDRRGPTPNELPDDSWVRDKLQKIQTVLQKIRGDDI